MANAVTVSEPGPKDAVRPRRGARRHPILAFVVRRTLAALGALFVASIVVYVAVSVLPGSVAELVAGRNAQFTDIRAINASLNLDDPLPQRYIAWLGGMVTGDFGDSTAALVQGLRQPVWDIIRSPMANSLALAGITFLLLVPLSFLLGVASALRAARLPDRVISLTSLVVSALPEFLVGTLLILVFFTRLDWLRPVSDPEGPFEHPQDLILPVLTLLGVSLAYATRLIRAAMIETMRSDYVRMARLNGYRERRVIVRYALRNALAPSVQALAQTGQYLIGGIIITENVFNFPGIGSQLVQAVSVHDVQMVAVVATLLAAIYIFMNVVADLIVVLLVPKLRTQL